MAFIEKRVKFLVFFAVFLVFFGNAFASVIIDSPTNALPVTKNPGDSVTVSFSYTDSFACSYDISIGSIASKHVENLCSYTVQQVYGGTTTIVNCNRSIIDTVALPVNVPAGKYSVSVSVNTLPGAGNCSTTSQGYTGSIESDAVVVAALTPTVCIMGALANCGPTSEIGICRQGIQTCNAQSQWDSCTGAVYPTTEICGNNLDDDCDGIVDNGCSGSGSECVPGYVGDCGPPNIGICRSGTRVCSGEGFFGNCQGAINPVKEVCGNGLDDDCDGVVDNGCPIIATGCAPGQTKPCGSSNVGVCKFGLQTCGIDGKWGSCQGVILPSTETCGDGLDNDCDEKVDNDCPPPLCVNGDSKSCGFGLNVGVCHDGTTVCVNNFWGSCAGAVLPSTEVCGNGLDDDCDGLTDEDCISVKSDCNAGQTKSCGGNSAAKICSLGVQTCTDENNWGSCNGIVLPKQLICDASVIEYCDGQEDTPNCPIKKYPEICGNSIDDDGDGLIDECADLAINSFVLVPDKIAPGMNVISRIKLRNTGNVESGPFSLAIFDGPLGFNKKLNKAIVSSLKPNEEIIVDLTFDSSGFSWNKTIFVTADPENIINEPNKLNNVASAVAIIFQKPNLVLRNVVFEKKTYSIGDSLTVSGIVENIGVVGIGKKFGLSLFFKIISDIAEQIVLVDWVR